MKRTSSKDSFTKAFTTAMPEKLSWAKSDSLEKASCRTSHRFVITLPTSRAEQSSSAIGISDRQVSRASIFHILIMAILPTIEASTNIKTPQPKHSCTVSRSLVNRLIRLPTLLVL